MPEFGMSRQRISVEFGTVFRPAAAAQWCDLRVKNCRFGPKSVRVARLIDPELSSLNLLSNSFKG